MRKYIFTLNNVLAFAWFIWMLTGTIFYSEVLDLSIPTGFYMAVNIGYSIGWGDIPETGHLDSQLFSTLYVLIGASFVGAALGIFAEHIVRDKDNWYEQEKKNLEYAHNIKYCSRPAKMWCFIIHYKDKLRSVVIWIVFIMIGTLAAWGTNDEFGFGNSLYFAVSSLSTGGHYSLPANNRDWVYGLTGLYCAFGVPVMAAAMATIASFFINIGTIEDTLKDVKKPVTHEEVDMLTEFGLADEDGEIDKSEFIILCMVRTGAASPELIKLIEQYFNELDTDKSGTLSIDEILQNRAQASAACDKLMETAYQEKGNAIIQKAVANQKRRQSERRSSSAFPTSFVSTNKFIEEENAEVRGEVSVDDENLPTDNPMMQKKNTKNNEQDENSKL